MATGVTAAIGLGVGTLAVSAVEATAEVVATSRGRGDPENTTLIAAAIIAGAGLAAARLLPNTSTTPLPVATGNSVARLLGGGAAAAALVITSDKATRQLVGPVSPAIGMVTAAAIGGTISAIRVNARDRRALAVGETGDRRQIQRPTTAVGMARSAALGGSVGAGLMVLAGVGVRTGRGLDGTGEPRPGAQRQQGHTAGRPLDRCRAHGARRVRRPRPAASADPARRRRGRGRLPGCPHEPVGHRGPREPDRLRRHRQGGPSVRPDDTGCPRDRRCHGRTGCRPDPGSRRLRECADPRDARRPGPLRARRPGRLREVGHRRRGPHRRGLRQLLVR